jgi:hypothetical protein
MTHRPDTNLRNLVAKWTIRGQTQEYIAKRLGISRMTLCEHYDYELHHKKIDLLIEVEDKLFDKAIEGDWKAVDMVLRTHGKLYDAKAPQIEPQKSELEKLQDNVTDDDIKPSTT